MDYFWEYGPVSQQNQSPEHPSMEELLGNTSVPGEGNTSGSGGLGTVEHILVPVFDVLILVLGVSGHFLVILILCGRERRARGAAGLAGPVMGTGTDVLLLALSAADLLFLAIMPFHTYAIATGHWPFGNFLCRMVSFLGALSVSASAFTLATLAATRYLTVVHPTKAYRLLTTRRVAAAAVALWVPACLLSAPQLVFRFVRLPPPRGADGLACFAIMSPQGQLVYGVFQFLLVFASPLVVIAVAYGAIYHFLWQRRRDGRAPQVERYQSQVTKTSAMLVLAFAFCWLPSYGLMLALLAGRSGATGSSPHYDAVSVWARLMATSSTVVNPILYVLMSHKFRQDLLGLLVWRRDGAQRGGAQATT